MDINAYGGRARGPAGRPGARGRGREHGGGLTVRPARTGSRSGRPLRSRPLRSRPLRSRSVSVGSPHGRAGRRRRSARTSPSTPPMLAAGTVTAGCAAAVASCRRCRPDSVRTGQSRLSRLSGAAVCGNLNTAGAARSLELASLDGEPGASPGWAVPFRSKPGRSGPGGAGNDVPRRCATRILRTGSGARASRTG